MSGAEGEEKATEEIKGVQHALHNEFRGFYTFWFGHLKHILKEAREQVLLVEEGATFQKD